MAIDLGDNGLVKAAGVCTMGADLDASDVSAVGIRNARFSFPGQVFVELVEQLSPLEMMAIATPIGQAARFITAEDNGDTEVLFTLRDGAGAFATGAFWFQVIRMTGSLTSKELIPA